VIALGLPVELIHLDIARKVCIEQLARNRPCARLLNLGNADFEGVVNPLQDLFAPREVGPVHHSNRVVRISL